MDPYRLNQSPEDAAADLSQSQHVTARMIRRMAKDISDAMVAGRKMLKALRPESKH